MANNIFISLCQQEGLTPIPEYPFAKDIGRRWRVDYFFAPNVALEVEGGVFINGRHTRPSGFLKDMEKYNEMARKGILLIRCTPDTLCTTIQLIKDCLCAT